MPQSGGGVDPANPDWEASDGGRRLADRDFRVIYRGKWGENRDFRLFGSPHFAEVFPLTPVLHGDVAYGHIVLTHAEGDVVNPSGCYRIFM